MKYQVGLPGRDQIFLEIELDSNTIKNAQLKGVGCTKLLDLLVQWRPLIKGKVTDVPLPQGEDHASLLMKQLLLQVQQLWSPPYQEEELCHCRGIPTAKVNAAIIAGAHTPEAVSAKTSASTACGTCRRDVMAQIDYFLSQAKKAA